MMINIMPVSVFAGMDHPACLPILVGGISGPCPLHGDFLRKSSCSRLKSVLSDLKLRASYGVNGNLPSSYYGYQSTYTTGRFIMENLLRGKVHWGMRN